MKIAEEFRADINAILEPYIKSFCALPRERQMNIMMIQSILKGSDVLIMKRELDAYLKVISWPLYCLFTFVDVNKLVLSLKGILKRERYQPLNVMRAIIHEKDLIISQLKTVDLTQASSEEDKISEILMEIKLVKSENQYLYQAITELEKELMALRNETKIYRERAERAESKIKKFEPDSPYFSVNTPQEQSHGLLSPTS